MTQRWLFILGVGRRRRKEYLNKNLDIPQPRGRRRGGTEKSKEII